MVQSESCLFRRHAAGPVLTASDWPYPMNTVFNPGATSHEGETVLLCRVEDRQGVSHLTVARSRNGRTDWSIDPHPLIDAGPNDPASCWGAEDPRVTRLEELGCWAITYTVYGPAGPAVALALTEDFRTLIPKGVILPPENKNASLFPRRVDGDFVLLHRPVSAASDTADIWLSRSSSLESWTIAEPVLRSRRGPAWDAVRIGAGPPPIATPRGWLLVYHGVKAGAGTQVYRAGLALLDLERPERVLRRSTQWVLSPSTRYERQGDVPNVVFPTGMIHRPDTGDLDLYYGAADTSIGLATAKLDEVLDFLWDCEPVDNGL